MSTNRAQFSAVDQAPDPTRLIRVLDSIAVDHTVQHLKRSVLTWLDIAAGESVIDAGCGTGEDLAILAGLVGPTGRAVGVEHSRTMLDEARHRSKGSAYPAEVVAGDIRSMGFPDSVFDACRCERVLQHIENPMTALLELRRILRPGGRLAVIDTDWESQVIEGPDPRLTTLVFESWARYVPNRSAGRRLLTQFHDAHLQHVTAAAETIVRTDNQFPFGPPFTTMSRTAHESGFMSLAESSVWLEQLQSLARDGEALWAVTMYGVRGVVLK